MKIALFRDTQFGSEVPFNHVPLIDGYVQASGWAEIDFPPMSADDQRVADELTALNKRQATFKADFDRQRKLIEDERAALQKTGT